MPTYTITVELDVVGHTAIAKDSSGSVIATASGFGASDARRKLKRLLGGVTSKTTTRTPIKKRRQSTKGGKMHNASGVIFAAKRRMEEFMPRNAKFKKKLS